MNELITSKDAGEIANQISVLANQVTQLRREISAKTEKVMDSLFAPEHAQHFRMIAEQLAKSSLVPKQYMGKPTDVFVAMAMGYQLGLPIEQAVQDIAVINGRPCLWGDGMLALVLSHPECEDVIEEPIYTGETLTGYRCTVKRRGKSDHTKCYTLEDAKKAKLLGKTGPWTDHTARMLQLRARAFALRDRFADALRGVKSAEEVTDYIDVDYRIEDRTALTRTEMLKKDFLTKKGAGNEIPTHVTDNVVAQEAAEDHESAPLGRAGEQEATAYNSHDAIPAVSRDQIDMIKSLIEEKQFTPERVQKALDYYEAESIESLPQDLGTHFIAQLRRA